MPQHYSRRFTDKELQTQLYLNDCVVWERQSAMKLDKEREIRAEQAADDDILWDLYGELAETVRREKMEIYRRLMRRRLYIADLIAATPMPPKHKRIMRYRYIKCWKLRTIRLHLSLTERRVQQIRQEAIREMAKYFDRIACDDPTYTKKPGLG